MATTSKRTRLVGDLGLPWANVVSEMVLAYLWVADWRSAERVCRALARQVKQYARRFPPWHAVRCLLPLKTPTTAESSAWITARHREQEATETWFACTKDKLASRQQSVWESLHAVELRVSWWAGRKDGQYRPIQFATIHVVVDLLRDSTLDVHDRIVEKVGGPIAPSGSVIGCNGMPDQRVNFRNEAPMWSCHPSIQDFDRLRVALQSKHVPDTVVHVKWLNDSGYEVWISLDDTLETVERYIIAIMGHPEDIYLKVGPHMDRQATLRSLGVQSHSTIYMYRRLR